MDSKTMQTVLPIAVILIVFALRFRNLNKPRPFNMGRLWLAPAFVILAVGFFLFNFPPSPTGWLVIMFGGAIGLVAGIKRGQWMHLERDPGTGKMLIRQSPAALVFLIAIVAARQLLKVEVGTGEPDATGHLPPAALLATDGLMAFALAMVVAMRWTLWQRAKAVPPHSEPAV